MDVQYTIEGASFEVPLEVLDAQGWTIRGAFVGRMGSRRVMGG